jgi:hypothetical protein
MTQDRDSGAAANEFGRETAKKLAAALGARMTKPGSNEAMWDGKLVALKSAAPTTNMIGMTYKMLDRVEEVVAALQKGDGTFEVFALSAAAFKSAMRPTRSKGSSSGRVGVVRRSVFETTGRSVGTKRLE